MYEVWGVRIRVNGTSTAYRVGREMYGIRRLVSDGNIRRVLYYGGP